MTATTLNTAPRTGRSSVSAGRRREAVDVVRRSRAAGFEVRRT
ncbi:hypothetical protein ACFW2X_05735 [Streptomyces antibioticus]